MNSDITLALMTGIDIPVQECQIILHQPKIKEIAYIGEQDFFTGVQTICLYKSLYVSQDKINLNDISTFKIFMTMMNDKQTIDKKNAVKQLLTLVCPSYTFIMTPQSLILQDSQNQTHLIDESNFEALQEKLRKIFCVQNTPMNQATFNPQDDMAREIAQKLMKGRERVAAQKSGSASNIFSSYLSALTIGTSSMNLEQLINCTMFQLYDLVQRYSLYTSWDLDVKTRLAGGKPDKQPENWMKDIH